MADLEIIFLLVLLIPIYVMIFYLLLCETIWWRRKLKNPKETKDGASRDSLADRTALPQAKFSDRI